MFLIEIGEPFFDFFAHGDGLLEVLVLRLEDVDAIVDDGALLEQLPLLAGRVLGQDRFGAPEDMGSAIDSAESEVSERAGKGLDGRIRVESYFCHIMAWAEPPHDCVITNHLYSAFVSPCASSVCKH